MYLSFKTQSDLKKYQVNRPTDVKLLAVWHMAGPHFAHTDLNQASECFEQTVPPRPGSRILFGVPSKPPASLGLEFLCSNGAMGFKIFHLG